MEESSRKLAELNTIDILRRMKTARERVGQDFGCIAGSGEQKQEPDLKRAQEQ